MNKRYTAMLGCDVLILIGMIGLGVSTNLIWLIVLFAGMIGLLGAMVS